MKGFVEQTIGILVAKHGDVNWSCLCPHIASLGDEPFLDGGCALGSPTIFQFSPSFATKDAVLFVCQMMHFIADYSATVSSARTSGVRFVIALSVAQEDSTHSVAFTIPLDGYKFR